MLDNSIENRYLASGINVTWHVVIENWTMSKANAIGYSIGELTTS